MSVEKEIILDETIFIISETDEKGVIDFVNDAFCRISKYSRNELLGKNHNIIRHKDMPKKIFKEMWETIKKGNVWTGCVKNSTKLGDFFWVHTTIYPLCRTDGTKGYLSSRKMASRTDIKNAEELYNQLLNEEKFQITPIKDF